MRTHHVRLRGMPIVIAVALIIYWSGRVAAMSGVIFDSLHATTPMSNWRPDFFGELLSGGNNQPAWPRGTWAGIN